MQKRTKFVIDGQGRKVAGATIKVTQYPGGADATIYSDDGVTPAANLLTSDANGRYEYYAANGHYTEVITTNLGAQPAINDILFDDSLTTNQQFVVATGTGDAMVVSAFATGYTLADGDEIRVRAPGANTVVAPTIALPGVGTLTIYRAGGRALALYDIKGSGHELHLRYRSSPARIELVNVGRIDIGNVKLDFGAVADGVTDDTTKCAAAITAMAPSGKALYWPAGTYMINALTLPGTALQSMSWKGESGTILKANTASAVMVQIGADISRTGFRRLESFKIDGDNLSGVIGIKAGTTVSAALQAYLEALDVRKCAVGIDLYSSMENSVKDVVCYLNTIGLKLRNDAVNGGGNANRFDGLRLQDNTIGMVIDGSASALPMHNNQWNQALVQSNTLCGVALFGCDEYQEFNCLHFEANATTGTTQLVDGNTVRKSTLQLNASKLVCNECSFSEASASPCIILENGSHLVLNNCGGYGNTGGTFIDGGLTNEVEFYGRATLLGLIKAYVSRWPDSYNEDGSNWSAIGVPLCQIDRTLPNDYVASSPYTPLLQNAVAAAVINANVDDAEMGVVSNATFGASPGNTGANRVTINALPTGVTSGDTWVVALMVKADQACNMTFNVTDGSFNRAEVDLDTKWRRVVLAFRAGATNTPLLYVYPNDSVGATVYFSRIHALRIASGGDVTRASEMISKGLFNDQGLSGLPAPGTASRQTTAVGNVGAGEDDLMTYSLPANSLSINGQGMRITAWGTKANNANAKTLKVHFGSQVTLTTSLAAAAAGNWKAEALVLRTGVNTQDWMTDLTGADEDQENGTAAQTETAAIIIKCTGEGVADNDIVQEGMLVEFLN